MKREARRRLKISKEKNIIFWIFVFLRADNTGFLILFFCG